MLKTQFISQIYWPDYLMNQKEKGFLIGWNMENFQCCITNFVKISDDTFSILQQTLASIGDENNSLLKSFSDTDSKPMVLGEWVPSLPDDYTPSLSYQRESIWLTLTSRKSGPLLHSLYSCGCLHRTSCHMIRYRAAQAKQLHSFSVSNSENSINNPTSFSGDASSSPNKTDLSYAIFQINYADDLGTLIWKSFVSSGWENLLGDKSIHDSNRGTDSRYAEAGTETDTLLPAQTASSSPLSLRDAPVVSTWVVLMMHGSYLWLSYLSLLQSLLEAPLSSIVAMRLSRMLRNCFHMITLPSVPRFIRSASMKDISITAAYFCERSRLLWHCIYSCVDFASYSNICGHRINKQATPDVKSHRQRWIFVYSRLVFICIDILLGVSFALYLWINRKSLLLFFHKIGAYVETNVLLGNLEFLNNAPYGIKFNKLLTERLSLVLGRSIVALSSGYNYFIRESYEEYLMLAIAFMGCFGFSFQMLFVVDIIRCLTVHISVIHMTLSILHYFQLKSLSTLFYLFQGKKKNFLRKRIDTLETDKSQLFFGTVYFTILFFLFPTFAAFYFLFTILLFCVVILQAMLWSCSIMVKEFPWCELYLFFRDPHMLSCGVRVDIDFIRSSQKVRESSGSNTSTTHQEGVKGKHQRKSKKELLRQTMRRENRRMQAELNDEAPLTATGDTKVTFSDDVTAFSLSKTDDANNDVFEEWNSSEEGVATLHSLKSHAVVGSDGIDLAASGASSDIENLLDMKRAPVSGKVGGAGNNEVDTASVRSSSSGTSANTNATSSSSSSEEIGWARCHSNEDTLDSGVDSIFAMENIWGGSDDIMEEETAKSTPLLSSSSVGDSASPLSISIGKSDFSYYSTTDLSPQVNRYSPRTRSIFPLTSCTTYLSIRPSTHNFFHHLLNPYFPYLAYWSQQKSIGRVVRGFVKGSPALDLQIIRAAFEISSSSLKSDGGRDLSASLSPKEECGSGAPWSGVWDGRGSEANKARGSGISNDSTQLPSSVLFPASFSSSPRDEVHAMALQQENVTSGGSHSINIHNYSSNNPSSSEVNSVSRSPNVLDLWSLLQGTCKRVHIEDTLQGEEVGTGSGEKTIFVYGVQSNKLVERKLVERHLFHFLMFTLSVCLLVALTGLCYIFSPSLWSIMAKGFHFINGVIRSSRQVSLKPNVPLKGQAVGTS